MSFIFSTYKYFIAKRRLKYWSPIEADIFRWNFLIFYYSFQFKKFFKACSVTLFNVFILQKVLTIFCDKIVYGGVTALSQIIFRSCKAKGYWWLPSTSSKAQFIYHDSKLLAHVFCFAELVQTLNSFMGWLGRATWTVHLISQTSYIEEIKYTNAKE